ncbi:MAG: hypothetical protein L0271_07915 [Gemmatimonadetes bacterium]|nr:hypothetical protein [Gemmatimonadota bacterium]
MVLLPVIALAAWIAVNRGARPTRAWAFVAVTAALLFASSWVAVRTGESGEEVVEEVVPATALEEHEESAERFLIATGAFTVLAALGLVGGHPGRYVRIAALIGAVALVPLGWLTGHSGGALVYEHGAASAFVVDAPNPADLGEERGGGP